MPGLFSCICGSPPAKPEPLLEARSAQPGVKQPIDLDRSTTSHKLSPLPRETNDGLNPSCTADSSLSDVMTQVCLILRALTELRGTPIEQLEGACWLLSDSIIDTGMVSISVLVEGSQPVSVCVASAGEMASHALLGVPVPLTLATPLALLPTQASSVERVICSQEGFTRVVTQDDIKVADKVSAIPPDWLELNRTAGFSAFATVPVVRTGRTVGILAVASTSQHAWANTSVVGLLSPIATWVSQLLDSSQLFKLPILLASTLLATDVEMMVQAMAAGLQDHFKAYKGLKLHARIAVLSGTSAAVVYEQQAQAPTRSHSKYLPDRLPDISIPQHGMNGNPEVRAKLNAIRKSTAVSSLQDFSALATAISAHDKNRDMFARESANLGMVMPSSGSIVLGSSPGKSGPSFSQLMIQSIARPGLGTSQKSVDSPRGSQLFSTAIQNDLAGERSRSPFAAAAVNLTPGRPGSMCLEANTFSGRAQDMAVTEDVLLRMVEELDDAGQGLLELVAYTMSSLEKTLLDWVLNQGGSQRGTWISDITTYMMQPNRPGKDIVLTSSSPALASLAVACMACSSGSRRGTGRCSSLSSMELVSASSERADPQEHPMLAVYLTSPTTLTAAQCHEVLKELHNVLSFLSTPLTLRLRTTLASSLSSLLSNMLGDGEVPTITSSISNHGQGASPANRILAAANMGKAKALSVNVNQPSGTRSFNGAAYGSNPTLSALARANNAELGTGSAPESASSSMVNNGNSWTSPALQRARSMTWYSKEPLRPQVAPLVKGLQDRLRGLLAESINLNCFNRHEDLHAVRADVLVAHGGFGNVFQGSWQGLDVAIKVVPQRTDTTDSVREAVELAVMSTVSHPNILGVQNYWTDVLVTATPLLPGERRPNGLLKLDSAAEKEREALSPRSPHVHSSLSQRLSGSHGQSSSLSAPLMDRDPDAKRSLVIIMELCDQGSLDDAIQRGAFRIQPPGQRTPRLHMLAVLTTLLEVAMALRHMHNMQLVHCDLKPGNVLLKSSMCDIRQFTTKLCDFGLVKIRQEGLPDLTETIRRATFTGTVTHSPPEMLKGDPNPAFSYDIFAFGIIMWELTASMPVYSGLSDRQVAQQVVYNHLRPEFPKNFDSQYKELAAACWAAEPTMRPTADEVVQRVGEMLMALRSRAQGITDAAQASHSANASVAGGSSGQLPNGQGAAAASAPELARSSSRKA